VSGRIFAARLLWLALLIPAPVSAQTPPEPRFNVSIGPDWLGSTGQGGEDAVLTRNPRGEFPLFDLETTLTGGIGASAAFGVRVTNTLSVEGTLRYHSARLESEVTGDVEGADGTATEAVQQLDILGGALWMPTAWRFGALRFYAAGGGGYLRQLHASHTLAESGQSYYAGGGLLVLFPRREGGAFTSTGLRVDVRAAMSAGGVAFDDRVHVAPALWAAFYLGL
jgi:hypothetical protein